MKNTFYITTPIYYPNAEPHMGHAYTTVLVDTLIRYYRLIGAETYFLTGIDEHAQKVVTAAEAAGKTPEEFVDGVVGKFKELYSDLNISFNQFIRTSDKEKHWPGVIEMWKRLEKAGDIYKGEYKGLYCIGCERFITEKELVDGKCPDHDTEPEHLKEENYFFKLSKYTDAVREKIESGEFKIVPEERKNELLGLLKDGLQDVSFSRPAKAVPWGVSVPGDDSQNIYVWCDALTNYISALGFGRSDDQPFKKFWPADYHVIGKDILRFHGAIWPAMLLSAKLPLPEALLVHGFITSGGRKMSKSIGNVQNPNDFIEEYGGEALRYYFVRELNPTEDGDMTKENFKEVYNGNLANGLGNVVSRVLTMVEKYDVDISDGMFPDVEGILSDEEVSEYRNAFEKAQINRAADVVWSLIAFMDSFIQEEKPFKTIEDDEEQAHRDIVFLVEKLWEVAVLLEPFMPDTSELIKESIKKQQAPKSLFPRKE